MTVYTRGEGGAPSDHAGQSNDLDRDPERQLPRGVDAPAGMVAAWSADDLLTVEEVSGILKVSVRWVYRHAKALPFSRRLSRKVLRFSRAGMARWLATKRL